MRASNRSIRALSAFVLVMAPLAFVEPAATAEGAGGVVGQDTVVVYRGEVGRDGAVTRSQVQVPVTVSSFRGATKPSQPVPPAPPAAPLDKLNPELAKAVSQPAAANSRQRVLITFQQDLKVPRLPDLNPDLPRTAAANVQVRAQADSMIADLTAQRTAGYQAISADLAKVGARTLNTFWLIKAMEVDAPTSALLGMAQRADVAYIQPVATRLAPPDFDPGNDEVFARWDLRSDTYFNLGLTLGYIGILDTGVRSTHTMFNNPPKPWIRRDLVHPEAPNPEDDWPGGHGTSTAAILTGNANLGQNLRGITGITVDSFKVYETQGPNAGLNRAAAVQGFQLALQVGDRVIVAEIQDDDHAYRGVATAADAAFDAGAVVIAANGNSGLDPAGQPVPLSVDSPALAQKVLGVGAIDVKTGETQGYQGRGPTADGRTKPDLQAPTNVETASSAGDTATWVFGGTSAAAPHAAGAAALIRNYLRGAREINPGSVYAFMLACESSFNGSSTLPQVDNTVGVGPVRLVEAPGIWQSATTTVYDRQTVSLPIGVYQQTDELKVAIWWAEQEQTHNDIDVSIYDPNGVYRGGSLSVGGVFERVNIVGPVVPGYWWVKVSGYHVVANPQQVHMVAITR